MMTQKTGEGCYEILFNFQLDDCILVKNYTILFPCFNPLSPNSDQQQFSPNNVHTLSRDKVVRI